MRCAYVSRLDCRRRPVLPVAASPRLRTWWTHAVGRSAPPLAAAKACGALRRSTDRSRSGPGYPRPEHCGAGRGVTPWRTRRALPATSLLTDVKSSAEKPTRLWRDVSGAADRAARAVLRTRAKLGSRDGSRARTSPLLLRDRTAWWSCRKHQEVACGSTFEMHSGTRSVLTGLRAPPEVHREDATTRPERLYDFGIDTDSGPDKYGAVCKDPRGSAYPHPRTGHNRCFRGPLGAAGATREGTAGPAPGAGRVVQLLSYPEH